MKTLFLSLIVALLAEAPLDDSAQEARAQNLMRELRCVACENEPVSQSSAAIAEDMRTRVRVMISEGASDQEVRDWFEDRYGEFVLFRPKGSGLDGVLLWGAPLLFLLAGGGVVAMLSRRRGKAAKDITGENV